MDSVLVISKNKIKIPHIHNRLDEDDIKLYNELSDGFINGDKDFYSKDVIRKSDCIIISLAEIDNTMFDLISNLKNSKYTKMIPIIVMLPAADTDIKLIDKILNVGAFDFLYKTTMNMLVKKIKNAIDYKKRYNRANIFENYYLSIFKNSKDLCFILTKDLKIKLFNNSAMRKFNLTSRYLGIYFPDIFRSDLVGKSLTKIFSNEHYLKKNEFTFKTKLNKSKNLKHLIHWKVICIREDNDNISSFLLLGEDLSNKETSDKKCVDKDEVIILKNKAVEFKNKAVAFKNKAIEFKKANKQLKSDYEKAQEQIEEMKLLKKELESAQEQIEEMNKIKHKIDQATEKLEEVNELKTELKDAQFQVEQVNNLRNELEKAYSRVKDIEKIKGDLEKSQIDEESIEKIKKIIDTIKKHNDALVDILKQYTSKATWKYLLQRILTHTRDSKDFLMEDFGTMVFGDIQGFTKFAERFPPQEVMLALNQMFNIVTEIVYEEGGDIDKFMGDAFFAFFSDPLNAVRAVYRVAKKVDILNDDRMMSGRTPLFFRFGINSGKAVRGDIGGEIRRENTLIGDAVNIAQRLESKSIPGQILISESTYKMIKDKVKVSEKVELKVKGRKNLVSAYYIESINSLVIEDEESVE